jgi:imidazolonepropionase-like amidohydrolase
MRTLITAALAVLLLTAWGVEAQVPAPPQDQTIAVTGATIHPVSGPAIQNGTIVFENGVITAIGANVQVPAGARQVDASGMHIYPGLIDSSSSVGLTEIGGIDVMTDTNEFGDINPNMRAQVAFHPESRHIGTTRAAGILTAVLSPSGGLIPGKTAALALDGWSWDHMTISENTGMVLNWPGAGNENQYDNSLQSIREVFADARAYYHRHQALNGAIRVTDPRWEAMIPVFAGEMPVIVNANEVRQIQDAITWGEEEGLSIVIRGGRDADLIAEHLARTGTPVLLTSVQGSPARGWSPYDQSMSTPALLHQAGVRFAISGGSSAAYANRLPWEAGTAAAYGLPVDEAVKAVTLYPAQFLGIDDRVGSLEVGKDATFLITTGNPLEYRTQIEQSYVQGRAIDMMDAHREFYERYSEKLRQMPPGTATGGRR